MLNTISMLNNSYYKMKSDKDFYRKPVIFQSLDKAENNTEIDEKRKPSLIGSIWGTLWILAAGLGISFVIFIISQLKKR